MKRALVKSLIAVIFFALNIACFQNCTRNNFGSNAREEGTTLQSNGGDSYPGKPDHYLTDDPANPCKRVSNLGKPFPKREIFWDGAKYTLVRDNCADLEPVVLDPALLQFNKALNTVVYNGESFNAHADLTEYNQVPLLCPAGRSIMNPNAPNVYANPLDLTKWLVHAGNPAFLFGSIEALPRFLVSITVADPTYQVDWDRVSQEPNIKPNTDYAVSILLAPGNLNQAMFRYDEHNGSNFAIGVNLTTGSIDSNVVANMSPITPVMQPYGAGWVLTIFFTSSATAQVSDTGVAAWRGDPTVVTLQPGDSIYATAGSWREVNLLCSP